MEEAFRAVRNVVSVLNTKNFFSRPTICGNKEDSGEDRRTHSTRRAILRVTQNQEHPQHPQGKGRSNVLYLVRTQPLPATSLAVYRAYPPPSCCVGLRADIIHQAWCSLPSTALTASSSSRTSPSSHTPCAFQACQRIQ